jgi:hypothetical protein
MREWAMQEIRDVRQSVPFTLLTTVERFWTNGALPAAIHRANTGRCGKALPADRGRWRGKGWLRLGIDNVFSAGRLLNLNGLLG